MRERCLKIKKENDNIMMEMLNFKDEVSKLKANLIEKDMSRESELSEIEDRIRKRKMDISGKLQKLRNNRKVARAKNQIKGNDVNKGKRAPTMRLALT
jgi:hypothetical protein